MGGGLGAGLGRAALRAASGLRVSPRPRSTAAAAPREQPPAAEEARPAPTPRGPGRRGEASQGVPRAQPPPPAVDFGDPREAFRSKSSAELVRSLVVLGLCTVEPLVQRNQEVSGPGGEAGRPRLRVGLGSRPPVFPAARPPCRALRAEVRPWPGRLSPRTGSASWGGGSGLQPPGAGCLPSVGAGYWTSAEVGARTRADHWHGPFRGNLEAV